MTDWRYFVTRLNGDGTENPLDWDVPLTGAQPLDELNAPGGITGNITPEYEHLQAADGEPIFKPWRTAIYAQADRNPRLMAGGIFEKWTATGPSLQLHAPGFTHYPTGQPYMHTMAPKIGADPAVVAKEIWDYLQGLPAGNLGVVVDELTTARRIGKTKTADTTNPDEYQNGPYQLGWWKTPDLAKEFQDLRSYTPFDYRMVHTLEQDGTITHRMERATRIGARQDQLRFTVGENILEEPTLEADGTGYATSVLVLGAGEGEKRKKGGATTPDEQVRRAVVIEDTSLASDAACTRRAHAELVVRSGRISLSRLTVTNHPHAGLGTFGVGDEILVNTGVGQVDRVSFWVRILSIGYNPEPDTMTLDTVRI